MKGLDNFTLDLKKCLRELEEFEHLLNTNQTLKETQDILPFFKRRLHLSAFIGVYVPQIIRFN